LWGNPIVLHFHIDPHSGIPIYRQLMDQVKYYAASAVLKPGDMLPSIRQLSRDLSVNPTTIVKAYSELQHDGIIELRHGKGVFLAEASRRMPARERIDALRRPARQLAVEASQMGVPESDVLRVVKEELTQLRKPEKK
jgi:GntR family transcriptional regulator